MKSGNLIVRFRTPQTYGSDIAEVTFYRNSTQVYVGPNKDFSYQMWYTALDIKDLSLKSWRGFIANVEQELRKKSLPVAQYEALRVSRDELYKAMFFYYPLRPDKIADKNPRDYGWIAPTYLGSDYGFFVTKYAWTEYGSWYEGTLQTVNGVSYILPDMTDPIVLVTRERSQGLHVIQTVKTYVPELSHLDWLLCKRPDTQPEDQIPVQ